MQVKISFTEFGSLPESTIRQFITIGAELCITYGEWWASVRCEEPESALETWILFNRASDRHERQVNRIIAERARKMPTGSERLRDLRYRNMIRLATDGTSLVVYVPSL